MLSIVAPIGPIPGIVAMRRLASFSRCHFMSLGSPKGSTNNNDFVSVNAV